MAQPNQESLQTNSWLYEWCPIKDELFALSDVIVARAGHTTISQCVDLGKPAIYIPISNHSEQIWNAEKCQKLGIGLELKSEDLTAKNLIGAVDVCLNDSRYEGECEEIAVSFKPIQWHSNGRPNHPLLPLTKNSKARQNKFGNITILRYHDRTVV